MAPVWAIQGAAVGHASSATTAIRPSCTAASLHTTNNRMELTAAIEGLRALKEPCEVEVITDSEYVKNGITSWVANWKRNNWLTSAKKPVVNQDLWEELDELAGKHKTTWLWTKGHALHVDNNRCDELATTAAREQRRSPR